jgi:hypothetical protein
MKIDAATSLFGFASHSSRLSHNSDEHRWQQLLPRLIAIAFWNCTGAHALKGGRQKVYKATAETQREAIKSENLCPSSHPTETTSESSKCSTRHISPRHSEKRKTKVKKTANQAT